MTKYVDRIRGVFMKKVIWSIMFFMLFFITACNEKLGENQYKITTESMSPVIEIGAIVTIEELIDESELKVGDYIMVASSIRNSETNEIKNVDVAMVIVEIQVTSVGGNDYYNFIISNNSGSASSTIPFSSIIGKIIEIDNP